MASLKLTEPAILISIWIVISQRKNVTKAHRSCTVIIKLRGGVVIYKRIWEWRACFPTRSRCRQIVYDLKDCSSCLVIRLHSTLIQWWIATTFGWVWGSDSGKALPSRSSLWKLRNYYAKPMYRPNQLQYGQRSKRKIIRSTGVIYRMLKGCSDSWISILYDSDLLTMAVGK